MFRLVRIVAGIAAVGMMTPLVGCAAEPTPEQIRHALERNVTISGTIQTKQVTKDEFMSRLSFHLTSLDVSFDNQSEFDIEFGKTLVFYEMNADASVMVGAVVEWGLKPIEYKQKLERTDLRPRFLLPDHEMRYTDDSSNEVVRKPSGVSGKGSFMANLSLMSRGDEQKEDQIPGSVFGKKRCDLKMNVTQTSWADRNATDRILLALPELHIKSNDGAGSFVPLAHFREAKGERQSYGARLWNVDRVEFIHLRKDELTRLIESIDSGLAARILALNWLTQLDPKNAGPVLAGTAKVGKPKTLLPVCFELMSVLKIPDLAEHAEGIFRGQEEPLALRFSALDYLTTIGKTPDLKPLIDTAIHQDAESRRVVIVKLGNMGLPQSKDALVRLLEVDSIKSNHEQIRSNLKKYDKK